MYFEFHSTYTEKVARPIKCRAEIHPDYKIEGFPNWFIGQIYWKDYAGVWEIAPWHIKERLRRHFLANECKRIGDIFTHWVNQVRAWE